MTYRDFKDLPRTPVCSKVLFDRAFENASNSIQHMININLDWHQWSKTFLIRGREMLLLSKNRSL